ncbi:MAG: hypothetical protein OXF75_12310 [Acidimicrobiaceae bacterium]|nr:hypothetical protein [Acidimicrobiaceae bacterium]
MLLKDDRGWSGWPQNCLWPRNSRKGKWKTSVGRALAREAVWVLGPDEVDTNELWEGWTIECLGFLGVEIDPASVHAAPFIVEFGPRVQHEFRQLRHRWRRQLSSVVDLRSGSGKCVDTFDVVTFGAVCELDYLTDPVYCPTRSSGFDYHETLYQADWPVGKLQSQRDEMTAWGMRGFRAEEFADLNDGRRVVLRDGRCWDFWPLNESDSIWRFANGRELTQQTISMLEPVDNDEWFESTLQRLESEGVRVDPASAHAAPFKVEFGPNVKNELHRRKPTN